MKKIPVDISISSYLGGPNGSGWTVTITDANAHVQIIEVELTHEQMGRVLSSQRIPGLKGKITDEKGYACIGKKHEIDEILVPIEDVSKLGFGKQNDALRERAFKMAAEFEDGSWEIAFPSRLERWNPHMVSGNFYRVSVCRWV